MPSIPVNIITIFLAVMHLGSRGQLLWALEGQNAVIRSIEHTVSGRHIVPASSHSPLILCPHASLPSFDGLCPSNTIYWLEVPVIAPNFLTRYWDWTVIQAMWGNVSGKAGPVCYTVRDWSEFITMGGGDSFLKIIFILQNPSYRFLLMTTHWYGKYFRWPPPPYFGKSSIIILINPPSGIKIYLMAPPPLKGKKIFHGPLNGKNIFLAPPPPRNESSLPPPPW